MSNITIDPEKLELVSKLNLTDDVLFHKVAEDKDACEEMLQIILQNPSLKIVSNQPQRFLRNIGNRSVILDLLCMDEQERYFHVEMQKKDDDDHQKRIRYNHSNIDTSFTETGIKYKNLPDVCCIFISKFDVFHEGRTVYHVNRVIQETGTVVYNGFQEIYVNTTIDDGSEIAELMQYFKNSTVTHKKFKHLSKRINYFKTVNEGVSEMCELVEEYANKRAEQVKKETAENLFHNGVSIEIVTKSIPDLPPEEIMEIYEEVMKEKNGTLV